MYNAGIRKLIRTFVLLVFGGSACPQSPVAFCDLVRNPEKYNGQEITVRVTYRYGFEWSELYCLDCLDKGKAWLDPVDMDKAAARGLKRAPKGSGTVNFTVQGVFMSGGTYGHQGLRYQIVPHKISDVAVINKGAKSPAEEKKAEKRWACGGTNPK